MKHGKTQPKPHSHASQSSASLCLQHHWCFYIFLLFTQSSNSSSSSLLLTSGDTSRVTRLMLAKVLRRSCWCESVMVTDGLSSVTGLRWTPFRMRANMLASGSTAGTHKIHIQQCNQNKCTTSHGRVLICFWKLKWIMKMCLPLKMTKKECGHTTVSKEHQSVIVRCCKLVS